MGKRAATPKKAAENKKLKTASSSAASAPSKGTDIALCDTVSLSGSSVCARHFAPMQPHEINEKIAELGLPSDYVVRLCDLCGGTSIHENIFAGHTDCVKWEPLLPWGSGSKHMPKGSICRICGYVFVKGGFLLSYASLTKYKKAIDGDPTLLQEFRQSRAKYMSMKLSNPSMYLSKTSEALIPNRLVQAVQAQADGMEAPNQYLMEISKYEKKFGKPDPSDVVTQGFRGKTITGVYVTKEEDEGMWKITRKQECTVSMNTTLSDVQLQEGQSESMFDSAFKTLLNTAVDDDSSMLLVELVGGSEGVLAVRR